MPRLWDTRLPEGLDLQLLLHRPINVTPTSSGKWINNPNPQFSIIDSSHILVLGGLNMPPKRHARSVSRRNTPLSPPKPPPQPKTRGARQIKPSDRSTSREVSPDAQHERQNDHGLVTVDEEADLHQSDSIDDLPSASIRSDSNTSLQSDLDGLDREEIIDNLADLHNESLALLSLLDHSSEEDLERVLHETTQIGSRSQKRLHARAKKLSTSREPFGGSDFINPPLIVRKLAGSIDLHRINYGRWRPDAILYLANLAQQMVAALSNAPEARENFLIYLYNNFPNPFVGQSEFSFGTQLDFETRELAIDVMTQFFIHKLDSNDPEHFPSPQALAEQIFQDDEALTRHYQDQDSQDELLLRLDEIKQCCTIGDDLPPPIDQLKELFPWPIFVLQTAEWTIARVEELQQTINKQGGVQNIVDLLNSGDYETDVKEASATDPGEGLETNDAGRTRPTSEPRAIASDSTPRPQNNPTTTPFTPAWFSANIREYREAKAKHALEVSGLESHLSSTSPAHEEHEVQESPTPVDDDDDFRPLQDDDDFRPLQDDDDGPVGLPTQSLRGYAHKVNNNDDAPIATQISTQITNTVMETLKRQAMEREKEYMPLPVKRSLLDRQPDASAVQWQSQGSDHSQERRPARIYKRTLEESGNEDDDEEDFEEDPRPPPKKLHQQKLKQPVLRSVHGSDDEGDLENSIDDNDKPYHNAVRPILQERVAPTTANRRLHSSQQASRPSQEVQSRASSNLPPRSTAPASTRSQRLPQSKLGTVQQEARMMKSLKKDVSSKPKVQKRRKWTEEEETRLFELVALYKNKWAYIEEMDATHEDGPRLHDRSQVNLKDKARNIVVAYVNARRPLPRGFEYASIGDRLETQLENDGVPYARNRRYTGAVDEDDE